MTAAVLVIEDEQTMRRVLGTALSGQGYYVWQAETIAEGIATFLRRAPQAILLDFGLPDGDGLEVVQAVRKRSEVPIVVISARGEEREQVRALDSGANDYVTKPFREAELFARLRAALRVAATHPHEHKLEVGPLTISQLYRKVYLYDEEVVLTATEFNLLNMMAWRAGRVVTHRQLLREVWGASHVEDVQYLRAFMRQLRRKLERDPSKPKLVLTTPGVGYRLEIPDEAGW
jgi:two-component system KDP operon response regulator KdpE